MMSLIKFTTQLDQYPHAIVEKGELRRATWLERVKISFLPKFRAEQETAVANVLVKKLRQADRETPRAAYKGRPAYIIKKWIERNPFIDKSTLKTLKTELLAYRLGITSENLKASEGLQEFTEKKAFLYNYLAFYRHILQTDTPTSPVKVMIDREYLGWNTKKAQELMKAKDVEGLWPYKYGKNGLQNEDLTNWIDPETRAFEHKEHPFPGKYLFTYCTYTSSLGPRFEGDHSWFRLTTPKGKIYEFGKYRPPRSFSIWKALMKLPATLQSPDSSSLWPVAPDPADDNGEPPLIHTDGVIRTRIHFEITEEQFHKALETVKSLQRNGQLSFGVADGSCVMLTQQMAEICGIKIETRSSLYKIALPLPVIRIVDKISKYIPPTIRKILYFIPGIFVNLIMCVVFGALAGEKENRYFNTIGELLDPNKSLVHYPWYLATRIKEDVEASRPAGNPCGIPEQFRL